MDVAFMYILNRMTRSIAWCVLMLLFCFCCTFLVVVPLAFVSLLKEAQIQTAPLKITRISMPD